MDDPLIVHFTSEFDALKSIIESSTLKICYSKEIFYVGESRVSSSAHPMVCFSEYSLNDLGNRTITYGKYGVAFTKKWAESKKMSPVIYIESSSQAAKGLGELLRARQNKLSSKLPDHLRLPIMQLKCFTKNAKGYNSGLDKSNFDFKTENEWRFVPTKKQIGGKLISQNLSKYLDNPQFYNKKLEYYPLKFNFTDIVTVFVENHSEKLELIKKTNLSDKQIKLANWKTN